MAAVQHGTIGEYDAAREEWTAYAERLEFYFTANGVDTPEKQRAVLLSVCGPETYGLIRSLVAPDKPGSRSFKELVDLVRDHYHPKPSAIVSRFKFTSCVRNHGETVAAFVARLRRATEHCNYGAALDEMLRDRLVGGINDERLQRRLLAEPDLTFVKAVDLAQAYESAAKHAKALQTVPQEGAVHAATHKSSPLPTATAHVKTCYRCGGNHHPSGCRFRDANCNYCGKKGHIAKVCRSRLQETPKSSRPQHPSRKPRRPSQQAHRLEEKAPLSLRHEPEIYTLFTLKSKKVAPFITTVEVDGSDLDMEVDTGASLSLISEDTYSSHWSAGAAPVLTPSSISVRTYSGEELKVLGSLMVDVRYKEQKCHLPLVVIQGHGPNLLGRDWLNKLRLDWRELHLLRSTPTTSLDQVLKRHAAIFKDELGTITGVTAKIQVNPAVQPCFYKPRPVPYALRNRVEAELERLEREGIIEPVSSSEWAAPIVPVLKRDGSIRVCGDYKLTANKAARVDSYPLPRVEDLFSSLAGGQAFSKLDLAHAYLQLPLDEASKPLLTINTSKGLFQYRRLPFGVSSAPAIFQRTIESILRGLPHTSVYLDDILVTGRDEEEHLRNLDAALTRLKEAGVRLKREKCAFLVSEIQYLGHRLSARGVRPTTDKVRAIVDAPTPQNVHQLSSFLGLINYYGKFLPNLSSLLAPLYLLLQKKAKWKWMKAQEKAFQESKTLLTSSPLLVHYDPAKKLVLSCDASPYGVGAVLSHVMEDGTDRPIAFASRSLAAAERNYAQLEREALAIVFGVKKFHPYLFGRRFTILSDHQPLKYLLGESRAIPSMASSRIQRWALTLSAYQYTMAYKPGAQHANADGLSRLPLPEVPHQVPPTGDTILLMESLQTMPITPAQIARWTDRDPLLAKVRNNIQYGWQHSDEPDVQPYQRRRAELSVEDGCVLWGRRVVVPPRGRSQALELLHEGHPGASRMKSLGRSFMWWPGMTAAVEEKVKSCSLCQLRAKVSSSCSPPSLGVASASMVASACQLRQSLHGSNVFDHCG